MRRLLLVTTGLLLAGIVALALALRSESFALDTARWAVATFSDLRLELRNPRLDLYAGRLSADEIHLVPKTEAGPALLSVLDISVYVPPFAIVEAKPMTSFLRVGSVQIYTSESDSTSDPQPTQWLGYLRWLPAELRIGQVHLVTASANTWIFPLKQVRGDRLQRDQYRLTADADYDGEPLGVTVDLLDVDKGWRKTAAQMSIKLHAPESGSEFTLGGELEGTVDDFKYNFEINAYYRDIREFLKGFEGGGDLAGELRLQGTMVGDASGFELSDATFLLINTPDYAFQAGGTLAYQSSGATDIELVANGEMASLSYLVNWIDLDVADFGRAQSSIRLSGSLDEPVIDEFKLTTSNESGLTVSVSGQLNLFEADADDGPGSNAINLDVQGPQLQVLERWLGELPFEPGPWRASGQLSGDPQNLSLTNVVLETGTPGDLEIRATGRVGRIVQPQDPQEEFTVADILMTIKAHAPDSAQLREVLGRDDIPPNHEIDAALTLSGTPQQLLLSQGELTITSDDLQASAGPLSAALRPAAAAPISDLSGPLRIALSDTSALSQYTNSEEPTQIPSLGQLAVSGRMTQQGDAFQLRDIVATISQGEFHIESRGHIGDLVLPGDISLQTTVTGLATHTLLSAALPGFEYQRPIADIEGEFEIRQTQGSWSVSGLALTAGDETTPLAFSLYGEARDLAGSPEANLQADFQVRETSLAEALTGLTMNPVAGKLRVETLQDEILGTLETTIGQTRINGSGRVALGEDSVDSLQLKLATPLLHLPDLGLGAASQSNQNEQTTEPNLESQGEVATETVQHSEPEQSEDAGQPLGLLATLRDEAPLFPVDVSLNMDAITGDYSKIDSLRIQVTGSDNRYTLQEFSARYNEALTEVRGIIDLNPELPAASLAGQAYALPLGAIFRDIGITTNVSGDLTIQGGVTVMGDTSATLVSNLNGSVAFALEDATIEGAAYDLLATDLLAWIYSGALTEKSTYLDCAMARFQLSQGVATSDSLFVESPRMIATGKAEFDLPRQRMDLRITPLSKSRLLQVPSEVRLKGKMSDPKADISTVSAVADATASALMLIPSLTLKLFGVDTSSGDSNRPCLADLGS